MIEAPTNVAMLFPTRVRPNKHTVKDERLTMASSGAANATQIPNIKTLERLAGFATVSRQDFQLPLFDSRPLGSLTVFAG